MSQSICEICKSVFIREKVNDGRPIACDKECRKDKNFLKKYSD